MYIDIFLGVFILLGLIQGYHRGIIRSLFAIAGLVFGFLAALKFSPMVVAGIDSLFQIDPRLSLLLGFLLTLALIMWGIRWIGLSIERTLQAASLNFINKAAGSVLFTAIMIVVYSAGIWFLSRTDLVSDAQKEQSVSYPYLMQVPEYTENAFESVKPVFREFWNKMESAMEQPAD